MANHTNRTILAAVPWAVLLTLAGLLSWSPAQGPPQSSSGEGLLLLRSGQVLSGKITPMGDRYEVAVHGGWISVKATDVEFHCGSLEEIYQKKRAMLPVPAARDHIELARWCQINGLLQAAEHELAQAEVLEPSHPLIPVLHRRIAISLNPPAKVAPLRKPDEGDARPSLLDLDKLVRGMPPGAVETFAQSVQPLLMNRCATAGCHGPTSTTKLSLLRISAARPPSRRLTQRNLQAVVAWIDAENPAASPLLNVPTRPHGTAKTAVFTQQNLLQYKQIVDWVYRVSWSLRPDEGVVPAAHSEPENPPAETISAVYVAPRTIDPTRQRDSGRSWAEQLDNLGPLDLEGSGTLPGAPSLPAGPRPSLQRGASATGFLPQDPFDPEIFNRRFPGR